MIGAVGKGIERVREAMRSRSPEFERRESVRFESDSVLFASASESALVHVAEDGSGALLLEGDLYGAAEADAEAQSRKLWQSYRAEGWKFVREIQGDFALCLWDASNRRLVVARDKIGVVPCFYHGSEDGIVFGTRLHSLRSCCGDPGLHPPALLKYLMFCYNPGEETFFEGIRRLRPAHAFVWEKGCSEAKSYWRLTFHPGEGGSEDAYAEGIRERLASAVERRMDVARRTGVFLSGGLDSSTMVSLLHRSGGRGIQTFSFRCRGESFDESHYARIVADHFGTEHSEVEYGAEDILLAEEMAGSMEEPFCDVGINIASYLLGKAAAGRIDDLFTGDGGDELFAGHPVYLADKTAALFRWIPAPLRHAMFAAGRRLPDSDQKKDWKVKVKRFSESFAFPASLGTHRWRMYYQPRELGELLRPEHADFLSPETLYSDIHRYNAEAEASDALGKSLSSDYQTVVQFYLRRMDLVRGMGIGPRFPMLDEEVVSYCGAIPNHLKIRGFSDTKYIERIAVEPLLPEEIVHRKDKLGHSIPLKNWMREPGKARDFILDLVSEQTIRGRGYFEPEAVRRMVDEHMDKTRNHSHRLWALAVLELWLRKCVDSFS